MYILFYKFFLLVLGEEERKTIKGPLGKLLVSNVAKLYYLYTLGYYKLALMFALYLCQVPFLDICNTMLDPSLPLTKLDYEEFGNPQIQSQFQYIQSYSPYDNIPSGVCHPSVLVTASFHDSRQVHFLCFLLFINTWTCIFYLVFYTCPSICLYQACT